MKTPASARDERTIVVENASYRWAYLVLTFGLLAIVAYRDFVWRESSWELLALVVFSGLVITLYQLAHRVLSRSWVMAVAVTVAVAAGVALVFAWLR